MGSKKIVLCGKGSNDLALSSRFDEGLRCKVEGLGFIQK